MEILQDFESVKWRRLFVMYICMLVICLAAIIFVIVYDKASLWGVDGCFDMQGEDEHEEQGEDVCCSFHKVFHSCQASSA